MQTAPVTDTAQHLTRLGLLPHQVERHLKGLQDIPVVRERRLAALGKPKLTSRAVWAAESLPQVTDELIHDLLPLLRSRTWTWGRTESEPDAWVGVAFGQFFGRTINVTSDCAGAVSGLRDELVEAGVIRRTVQRHGATRPRAIVEVLRWRHRFRPADRG